MSLFFANAKSRFSHNEAHIVKPGFTEGIHRVRTDLEKSLNLTMVLENSWNFKIVPFVLEFCKIALENVKLSLKIIKYTDSFPFFWIYAMRERKLCEIAGFVEE